MELFSQMKKILCQNTCWIQPDLKENRINKLKAYIYILLMLVPYLLKHLHLANFFFTSSAFDAVWCSLLLCTSSCSEGDTTNSVSLGNARKRKGRQYCTELRKRPKLAASCYLVASLGFPSSSTTVVHLYFSLSCLLLLCLVSDPFRASFLLISTVAGELKHS